MLRILVCGVFAAASLLSQEPVQLTVNAARVAGPIQPIWNYFGYDEPNYTYAQNGSKLIRELAALDYQPVYVRTHFLLATGDGRSGLKWGSTNAYTEDANGKPIYDWSIVDRILETYLKAGAKPFVEIGFMPKALSIRPDPYNVEWIPGAPNNGYYAGWSYPPKDFDKWGELVYQWVRHEVEKHGAAEVSTWYWEVWNEPNNAYWHGTPEEYDRLYDVAAAAVKRALPSARVGGPASTGPANEKAAAFLRQFLEHCQQHGSPLDFITYHAKGQPTVKDGHVQMGIAKNLRDVDGGFRIINSFPTFASLPIVLSESDPEGCAACSARYYPPNAYRNGELYAVYTAVMIKNILDLASQAKTNISGMMTWAFEFENQPYFDGLRTLATNGVDKPVLNVFRMAAKLSGQRLAVESSGAVPLPQMLANGVSDNSDINAIASAEGHNINVLAWNYNDDPTKAKDETIELRITNLRARRMKLRRFQIDANHSNSWTAWKSMGSPQKPTAKQYALLLKAGQLEQTEAPHRVSAKNGLLALNIALPGEAVTLLQFSW